MSRSDPNQKQRDENAKTTKALATHQCVCKAIKPKWLSEPRCGYCELIVKNDEPVGAELLPARSVDAFSDEALELGRELGLGSADGPGMEVQAGYRGMLVISLNSMIDVEFSEEWLLAVLPPGPREQVEQSDLVIITDPNARLAKVVKCKTRAGEYLEMHTAAIG